MGTRLMTRVVPRMSWTRPCSALSPASVPGREDAGHNGPDVSRASFRAVEEGFRRGGDEVHFALCVVHHDAFVDGVEDGSKRAVRWRSDRRARATLTASRSVRLADISPSMISSVGNPAAVAHWHTSVPRATKSSTSAGSSWMSRRCIVFGAVKVFLDSHAKGFSTLERPGSGVEYRKNATLRTCPA